LRGRRLPAGLDGIEDHLHAEAENTRLLLASAPRPDGDLDEVRRPRREVTAGS